MKEVTTDTPKSLLEPLDVRLSKEERVSLGFELYQSVQQALADRAQFNINLDYYDRLYDMHVEPKSVPWPNSSNVFLPYIPMVVDTIAARLAAMVFQPRFIVVSGNTGEAEATSHLVERYYNAEVSKNDWREPLFTFMLHGLLYGTGVLGVFWKRHVITRKKRLYQALTDPDTGLPLADPETGEPDYEPQVVTVNEVIDDNVELVPIPLRDFVMYPSWAKSVDEALGVARSVYLTEAQLTAMVKAGDLNAEDVEYALSFVPEGLDERASDRQGIPPAITADDTITISEGEVNASTVPKQRGPIKVWQVFTSQYEVSKNEREMVFWVADKCQRMLGFKPYRYWMGIRPFATYTPLPRTQLGIGYSIPDRLKTVQEEINTQQNQINDAIDRALAPPIVVRRGTRLITQDNRVGPDSYWETDGEPNEYLWFPALPQVPLEVMQNKDAIQALGLQLVGLTAPFNPGGNASRRSAKESAIMAASAGVRIDLLAERLRQSLGSVFKRIHELKIQYGPENMSTTVNNNGTTNRLSVPKRILTLDYDIFVNGSGGPLDRTARAQDTMVLYALLMKNPLIAGNLQRVYNLTRIMLEEHNRPDVQQIIGTQEEAQQQQQAAQQQQALQGQMAAQQQRAKEQQTNRPQPGPQRPSAPPGRVG